MPISFSEFKFLGSDPGRRGDRARDSAPKSLACVARLRSGAWSGEYREAVELQSPGFDAQRRTLGHEIRKPVTLKALYKLSFMVAPRHL